MPDYLTPYPDTNTIPLFLLRPSEADADQLSGLLDFSDWIEEQPNSLAAWVEANDFKANIGTACLLPSEGGQIESIAVGLGTDPSLWDWAAVPSTLPKGTYQIKNDLTVDEANKLALGWALATYQFARYGKKSVVFPTLVWPKTCDKAFQLQIAKAIYLVRDLINTPASDMGPKELATAAEQLALENNADYRIIIGGDLLKENYPAIHTVGRASTREPRLIDFTWGKETNPKVTLVGKGVCFDTGGLDMKSSAGMQLMKKDMGGAANALGAASMIMAANLPVRLRVLIPAVENSISGNAMRPRDVIITRAGLGVEIGNTDAEGRLVLADALTEASSEAPEIIVDFATLTGAARVALGTELPALFCNNEGIASDILAASKLVNDPLWQLPLWKRYAKHIESKITDLNNCPDNGYGGAITAALFLQAFVEPGILWAHIDLMGWNQGSQPGRPEGGEAMGARAIFEFIQNRFRN